MNETSRRINLIWNHPVYREHYELLRAYEEDRPFCGHSLEHFLDVARLMWIYNLEEHTDLDRDLVYAAALLHDIGRSLQYMSGIPHHLAGAQLADQILPDCEFTEDETKEICDAISEHRKNTASEEKAETFSALAAWLYRADKASRNCLVCEVQQDCKWPDEKRNMTLKY